MFGFYTLVEHKDPFILHSQYRGCWCPGDISCQDITSHGIDLAYPEKFQQHLGLNAYIHFQEKNQHLKVEIVALWCHKVTLVEVMVCCPRECLCKAN